MIIKNILDKKKSPIPINLHLKKNTVLPIKINKKIEIVTVPKLSDVTQNQKNVGIVLDEKIILHILSKRYQSVLITEINTEKDLEELTLRNPDLVFSGVKYFNFYNKTIWLNDYLEDYGINYIASNKTALDNESDKNTAKRIMKKSKVKTADFFITKPGEHSDVSLLPIKFPLFVKPVTGGDSRGIDAHSIVNDFLSFEAKVLDIHLKQNSPSLVETYLSGKEYSVGIFENSTDGSLNAMPIEIIVKENLNGHCILDFNVKKNDEEKVIPVSDIKIFNKLCKIAKDSFRALGGKSLGRIDIKMDQHGVPHFIEANLMPGLRQGYFYRSCQINLDMSYEDMIFNIASTGLNS
tara:strand:- start:1181 stop:2233 length:1053 start_codon:yes stop_codon:yes gene_type:complete